MKRINQLTLWALFVAFVSACTPKAGDYTQVIPANATTVVALDANSLGNKAGLNDSDNRVFIEKMLEAITSGMKPASAAHLKDIVKEPSQSGISSKDPLYIFSSPSLTQPVVVARVNDVKKLRTTLDIMTSDVMGGTVTDKDGISIMKTNDLFMVYNSSSVIMGNINRNFNEDSVIGFLNAKAEESIHQSPYFQQMQKRKGDVLFFSSLDSFTRQIIGSMGVPASLGMDLSDLFFIGDVSFEKGKVVSHLEYATQNQELDNLLKANTQVMKKIKGKFVADIPASPLLFFTINLDGEGFYNNINQELEKAIGNSNDAAMVKEIISAFKGDISFALLDVGMGSMPTFVAYAEVTNNNIFDAIYQNKDKLGLKRGEDITQLTANEYQYLSAEFNCYFGVKDNKAYITNDELLHKSGTANNTSLKNARYISNMNGKLQFAIVDLDAILALPVVKMMGEFGGSDYKMFMDIFSKFSYLEATSDNYKEAEITLHLNTKDTNALKLFVDMVKKYSGME